MRYLINDNPVRVYYDPDGENYEVEGMDMNKKYTVYCTWVMSGQYYVDAESEEEARDMVKVLPLPDNGDFVGDSFSVEGAELS